jgi:hypothetical protein
MALKIDTCNAELAWRRSRDAGCGVVRPVRVVFGLAVPVWTLPAVRGSAGDWARESGA